MYEETNSQFKTGIGQAASPPEVIQLDEAISIVFTIIFCFVVFVIFLVMFSEE